MASGSCKSLTVSPQGQQCKMAYLGVAAEKVDAAIAFSLEQTGCDELQLKIEQWNAPSAVLNKKDTVVVLTTGYGKSRVLVTAFRNALHWEAQIKERTLMYSPRWLL